MIKNIYQQRIKNFEHFDFHLFSEYNTPKICKGHMFLMLFLVNVNKYIIIIIIIKHQT